MYRLSREEYVKLSSSRSKSDLSADIRELIYSSFEKYEKLKFDRKERDTEDLVFELYQKLAKVTDTSSENFCTGIYVDEVQDLSPAQIGLLKFVCQDVTQFVFAGDTAQTIAKGVSFRFETVKDIFFKEYLHIFEREKAKELTPKIWELTVNYRTHNGILFLARNIIDLIEYFFPDSIDKLKKESSPISGPLPMCLELDGTGNLVTELFNSDSSEMIVDFGAEQGITKA